MGGLQIKSIEELKEKGYYIIEDEDELQTIETNLKQVIEDSGYTMTEIANFMGCTRAVLSNLIVNPKAMPTVKALKLSKILGKPVEELFTLKPDAWLNDCERTKTGVLLLNSETLEFVSRQQQWEETNRKGYGYVNRITGKKYSPQERQKEYNRILKSNPTEESRLAAKKFLKETPSIYVHVMKDVGALWRD